jgi:hypothetical protein
VGNLGSHSRVQGDIMERGHTIQISVKVRRKKGKQVTKEALQKAIERRIENGINPPGIIITAINWRAGRRDYTYTKSSDIEAILDKLRYIPEIRPSVFHKVR